MTYHIEIDGVLERRFAAADDNEAAKQIRLLVAQHPEWPGERDVIVTNPDGKRWYSIVYKFR